MKIFIAGIMQGSKIGLGLYEQDYRQQIQEAIIANHPHAEIVDPMMLHPQSMAYDDARASEVLLEMAKAAASADVVIAYLPKASMGTAQEMVRAYDQNRLIITISPLDKNWFIRAFSDKWFHTLDEFCVWIRQVNLSNLLK